MKTNIRKSNRSLIKLHFLKHQVYKKNQNYRFGSYIHNLPLIFKKILNIIYFYNKKDKDILFVGFNNNKVLLNQLTQKFITSSFFPLYIKTVKKLPELIVFNTISETDLILINQLKHKGVVVVSFESDVTTTFVELPQVGLLNSNKVGKFYFFLIFSLLNKK